MTRYYLCRKKKNALNQKEEIIKINRADWEILRNYKKKNLFTKGI